MRSRLILLLVKCITISFLQAEPMDYYWSESPQSPAQHLLTPRNYQMMKEYIPINSSPYIYYQMPVNRDNYQFSDVQQNSENLMLETSRKLPNKILSVKNQNSHKKRNFGELSRYLEPPSLHSASNYQKYLKHMVDNESQDLVPYNHRPGKLSDKKKNDSRSKFIRDHDPFQHDEVDSKEISESKINANEKKKSSLEKLELSDDGDRIDFQIQGHKGPATYIFGFDTGDGKNRQFRLEEKLRDGTVKGHYGYYDARGKLRAIKYLAHPMDGYKEKHHESGISSSEKE